jgi:hypothetical protein
MNSAARYRFRLAPRFKTPTEPHSSMTHNRRNQRAPLLCRLADINAWTRLSTLSLSSAYKGDRSFHPLSQLFLQCRGKLPPASHRSSTPILDSFCLGNPLDRAVVLPHVLTTSAISSALTMASCACRPRPPMRASLLAYCCWCAPPSCVSPLFRPCAAKELSWGKF